MWQQILKAELASQSGYAQLDFDNIVEEEEDNCKKRFIEIAKRLQKMAEEIDRTLPEEILDTSFLGKKSTITFNKTRDLNGNPSHSRIDILHDYSELSNIPEEVVCKALELLDGQRAETINIGEYSLTSFNYFGEQRYHPRKIRSTKRVTIYGPRSSGIMAYLGFVLRIYDKDVKYSQDLFDKLAGVMK